MRGTVRNRWGLYWTLNKISYSQIKVRCRYDQDNQIKHYETEASTGNIYRAMKQKNQDLQKGKGDAYGKCNTSFNCRAAWNGSVCD